MGGASCATEGPAFGFGAKGFSGASSSAARNGLKASRRAGANGLNAGSSSSSPKGFRGREGLGGGAAAAGSSQLRRTAFDPRSASSQ